MLREGRWARKRLPWDSQMSLAKFGTRGAGLMGRKWVGWRIMGCTIVNRESLQAGKGVCHGWVGSRLWRPVILVWGNVGPLLAEGQRKKGLIQKV